MMTTLEIPLIEQSFISINVNFSQILVEVQNKIQAMSRNVAPSWCLRLRLPSLISHNIRDGTPETRIVLKMRKNLSGFLLSHIAE